MQHPKSPISFNHPLAPAKAENSLGPRSPQLPTERHPDILYQMTSNLDRPDVGRMPLRPDVVVL